MTCPLVPPKACCLLLYRIALALFQDVTALVFLQLGILVVDGATLRPDDAHVGGVGLDELLDFLVGEALVLEDATLEVVEEPGRGVVVALAQALPFLLDKDGDECRNGNAQLLELVGMNLVAHALVLEVDELDMHGLALEARERLLDEGARGSCAHP